MAVLIFGIPATIQSFEFDENIRNRIESAGTPPKIEINNEIIYASIALPLFYEKRGYQPAWIYKKKLSENAKRLIGEIKLASNEGLIPDDYHLIKISEMSDKLKNEKNIELLVDLDLLLTDAFLIYASHLLSGKVNPITIDPEWFTNLKEADFVSILDSSLYHNNISKALRDLLPMHDKYKRLKQGLENYRKIEDQGGWREIPDGPLPKIGDNDNRVPLIRQRLIAAEDLKEIAVIDSTRYDSSLVDAIKRFQKRHGLDIDGQLGPKTIAAMSVSVLERINQIRLNLERWRWLPQFFGEKYIIVNIANFELDVYEKNQIVLDMRIIAGKTYRRTPVFSDQMSYLVFSPYWNIPNNITVSDIIPMIRKDIEYLNKMKIKVLHGYGSNMKNIDPMTINWEDIDNFNKNYWLRQEPGPANLLGGVKFMFPNRFNVYLHDTPAKDLFGKTSRDFSSGCIRIEKPEELAIYLLKDQFEWTLDKIREAMKRGTEQTVRLFPAMPVHILYWTSWVDENGLINFRNDIYNRDKSLLDALNEKSTTN